MPDMSDSNGCPLVTMDRNVCSNNFTSSRRRGVLHIVSNRKPRFCNKVGRNSASVTTLCDSDSGTVKGSFTASSNKPSAYVKRCKDNAFIIGAAPLKFIELVKTRFNPSRMNSGVALSRIHVKSNVPRSIGVGITER